MSNAPTPSPLPTLKSFTSSAYSLRKSRLKAAKLKAPRSLPTPATTSSSPNISWERRYRERESGKFLFNLCVLVVGIIVIFAVRVFERYRLSSVENEYLNFADLDVGALVGLKDGCSFLTVPYGRIKDKGFESNFWRAGKPLMVRWEEGTMTDQSRPMHTLGELSRAGECRAEGRCRTSDNGGTNFAGGGGKAAVQMDEIESSIIRSMVLPSWSSTSFMPSGDGGGLSAHRISVSLPSYRYLQKQESLDERGGHGGKVDDGVIFMKEAEVTIPLLPTLSHLLYLSSPSSVYVRIMKHGTSRGQSCVMDNGDVLFVPQGWEVRGFPVKKKEVEKGLEMVLVSQ